MLVIGHDDFGRRIADLLEADFAQFEKRIFPDGEVCPRIIDDVTESNIILVNRMSIPPKPNDYYLETILLMKALKGFGVESIDVVMPYFVYSRQDKVFRKGEPHSARYVLDLLKHCGATRFFTVVSHVNRAEDMIDADLPAYNIDGFSAIGAYLKKLDLKDPLVLGADLSVDIFAQKVAKALGVDSASMEKSRNLDTGKLSTSEISLDVEGRDLVIVDDIISSGGTMLKSIEIGKQSRARRIVCGAIHGVFSPGTLEKLTQNVWKIATTDTIINPAAEVSIVEKIAERIKVVAL
ncbi:MAG: ribose-phosphate diphosphokinase [Candidatus Aenigmarchaeota archaeon]|nr:ribose-phosphate diphosphokinase [Candidatus Aenigmarchaeota archaeon]